MTSDLVVVENIKDHPLVNMSGNPGVLAWEVVVKHPGSVFYGLDEPFAITSYPFRNSFMRDSHSGEYVLGKHYVLSTKIGNVEEANGTWGLGCLANFFQILKSELSTGIITLLYISSSPILIVFFFRNSFPVRQQRYASSSCLFLTVTPTSVAVLCSCCLCFYEP